MNDDELITLVRDQRSKVQMTTPVDEIISRGRSVHARRRIPAVAGALAMVAGAAVAVTALVPSSHQDSSQPGTQLAAWTVTRQADGDVNVTIRELRNPAGLATALHADGVPAYVAFAAPVPAYCQAYPASKPQLQAIYQFHQGDGSAVLVVHPSAIPNGAGLFFFDVGANPVVSGDPLFTVIAGRAVHIGLVRASQRCPVAEPSGLSS
jgi:hypothetical protein